MRTINKILKHNFTPDEEEGLLLSGIANGCGGKGGVNFDEIISKNLRLIPGYSYHKKKVLFEDIKRICIEHDVDFRLQLGFIKSNFLFAYKIYKLLHWAKMAQRVGVSIVCFILLHKFGKKFYNLNK